MSRSAPLARIAPSAAPKVLAALVALTFAPLALAQSSVLVVDDDGGVGVDFTDIAPAIAAASAGDTLLVKDGAYGGFTVDGVSLRIVAENDVVPRVQGTVLVRQIALGQRVVLRGLTIVPPDGEGLVLEQCAGHVWIERCSATGRDGPDWVDVSEAFTPGFGRGHHGLRVVDCNTVSLHRSQFYGGAGGRPSFVLADFAGGGDGLYVYDSSVTARSTLGIGGAGGGSANPLVQGAVDTDGGDGGHGAEIVDGVFYTAGSRYDGGNGGDAEWGLDGFTQLPIVGLPGDGGDGVHATQLSPVLRYQDTALHGGFAGVAYDPSGGGTKPGLDGAPLETTGATVTPLPGDAFRWYSAQGVVRSGDTVTFTQTQPPLAGPTVLGLGLHPTTLWQPALNGNVVVQPLFYYFDPIFVSVPSMPLTHEFVLPVNIPLPPGTSLSVFTQMIRVDPANSLPALSSGSTITILDPTL